MKKIIISVAIFSILTPILSFAKISQPETMDQVKQLGEKALEVTKTKLPGIFGDIWQNDVIPFYKKMFDWIKANLWDNWLGPWLKNLWSATVNIFKSEAQQRKPQVEQDFQTQKEQIKQEAPVVGKTLWEKFLELIK